MVSYLTEVATLYPRTIQLAKIIEKKSVLLLGPRQTGKSTLIKTQLGSAPLYNLLDAGLYGRLSADPTALRREILAIRPLPKVVVIDEVQRLPELMNEAHILIEDHGIKLVLTGSSARALRRKGVNLLGGRARVVPLHPLTTAEIGESFRLLQALNDGLLPAIYGDADADAHLSDYAGTYLREEVAAEGLTRNLPSFSRFLAVAAGCNGQIINHTNIASDAAVKRTTVIDYFQVLRDTLLGFDLEPWRGSKKRKAIATSKFYLFDPGVTRHLAGSGPVLMKGAGFGAAFEHLIFCELRAALDYGRAKSLHYWRSTSGLEVDFLLNEKIAIEVKATAIPKSIDIRGLHALGEELGGLRRYLFCTVERPQIISGVEALPWVEGLRRMWNGDL